MTDSGSKSQDPTDIEINTPIFVSRLRLSMIMIAEGIMAISQPNAARYARMLFDLAGEVAPLEEELRTYFLERRKARLAARLARISAIFKAKPKSFRKSKPQRPPI